MTDDRATAEWKRAIECLGAAQLCLEGGFYADAVSRAYYAVLHAARSVLLLYHVETTSHRGVARMFSLHLVRTGLVESQWASELGELYGLREFADYDVETEFDQVVAGNVCCRASEFLNRIRLFLPDVFPLET